MAETKNSASDVEYNDNGTKNPDFVPPKSDSEGAGAGTENKGAEKIFKKEGEEEVSFDDTINPEKPPEIPVRQSTAQHIIARKNEQIKKLKSKKDEEEAESEDSDEDKEGADDSTKSAISKEVQKAVAPLLGKLASDADEAEFQALIASEPEAKKYANHIKAYMAHDAYKGVPPSFIFRSLAFAAAQALGAKRKAAADLEAKQNKGGGRTVIENAKVGDLPSAEDIQNMSEEDFSKMEKDVARGKYIKK